MIFYLSNLSAYFSSLVFWYAKSMHISAIWSLVSELDVLISYLVFWCANFKHHGFVFIGRPDSVHEIDRYTVAIRAGQVKGVVSSSKKVMESYK